MPGPGHDAAIRASDRDREHAVRLLRDAHAEGRLDLDELMERTSAAFAATAWGELAELTADLPADQRFVPAGTGDGRPDFQQARYGPPHPFAALWPVAIIWLAVAAAAHVAAAIPLILLAVFVLRAACWRVPPEGRPGGSLARCGSRRPAPRGGIPGSHGSAVTAAWNDDGSGD